ncbi:MAG: DNA cytosine methyltransferase, partial [Cetobacterium sp.]
MGSKKGLTVLSLFDGMSCGRIALKRADINVAKYYSSEIDRFALQIASENHPYDDECRLGDIKNISADQFNEGIDLLIGGSPCQSLSRSGDGSGFDGKSKLFWEYVRVLREVSPKYFLLENVVMKKEWEDIITKELGVSPVKICSSKFSAQKRQRLYWTNIPFEKDVVDKGVSIMDVIDRRADRQDMSHHPVVLRKEPNYFLIKNATKLGYAIANDGDCVNMEVPNSKTRRGRVSVGKTNTLNTACNYGVVIDGKLQSLTITEYERLQTLP